MSWLRGADFRVRLTTDTGVVLLACERVGFQRTSEAREVSNTEGRAGNSAVGDVPRTTAKIGDIPAGIITLSQPSIDPANNVWVALSLAPGDYCQVEIICGDARGEATASTGAMNCLYSQDNVEAQTPGKAPVTMRFETDGVDLLTMTMFAR